MADLLFVPLKKSSDVDIVKPLKNLIQSTYNTADSNEDYTEELNELARLRSNAIWKVSEKSSLEALYSYYDQLAALETKIPPQEVQIPFKWKDAFDKGSLFGGRMSLTVSSLAFERLCVLFNIGAMQSALAAREPLDTEDSLKLAAKLFQQSAGVFGYLKAHILLAVHGEPTPDLSPDALQALQQLMLAQAQEVIVYKCIRDEMKEGMVAKVCAQAEELYADAARGLQREALRHLWDRDWSNAVANKQQALRGMAQVYQAAACRARQAVGEEIARLQLAVELLNGAPGRAAEAGARALRRLQEARKDNDFIYHERVPDARQLEPVARAAVARPLEPPARWAAGRELLAALEPLPLRQALQAAAARRQALVGAELDRLRDDAQLLNAALASLSLPACVESCDGGLPASIREKAGSVRAAGGMPALRRLMAELPELLQRNREVLDETERLIREEREADDALRAQFGARWTRSPSERLTEAFSTNAAKYRQIIDNAVRADDIVQQKFQQHRESIALLSGDEDDITAGVPSAAGAADGDAGCVRELRALLADVEALRAERAALDAELRALEVDLRPRFQQALAEGGAIDEPALAAAALGAALAPLQRRAADAHARQEQLQAALQERHAALMAARGGGGERDAALARLAAAYDAYKDLTGNLEEGVKFYNDLTQLLVAFQNKVSDFCFARKTEKEELMKDLTQEASRPQRPAPTPPQPAVEPEATARREPPARPPPPSAAPAASASLPYPQQPQGMPLPFAAPPLAYYAPPMPAMYNPYATLPYPHHARMPPAQPYQAYQYPPPQPGYQPPPAGYNPYPQQ